MYLHDGCTAAVVLLGNPTQAHLWTCRVHSPFIESLFTMAVFKVINTTAMFNQDDTPAARTWKRLENAAIRAVSLQNDYMPLQGEEDTYQHRPAASNLLPVEPKRYPLQGRMLTGESYVTCAPWRTIDYPCDVIGLHKEILDFYEYIKPRPSEIRMRADLVDRVKRVVLQQYPEATVEVFGSYRTGLYLPTSDIDICVYGKWAKLPLFTLEEALHKANIAVKGSLMVIDKTTVPIIKFIDGLTEVKVDISFNTELGPRSVDLIKDYMQQFPHITKLIFVLKQFLTQRQLNEVYFGGINSYNLFLLFVSFFQLHPRNQASDKSANLGVLLIEFFELYGKNFNYMKTGICINDGGSYIPKEQVQNSERTDNGLLYIQEPLNHTQNTARGCYGMWQVKQAFENAFLRLHTAVINRDNPPLKSSSLLSSIIKVYTEVHEYRSWVENKWSSEGKVP